MSESAALWQVGFVKGFDCVIACVVLLGLSVIASWAVFGNPDAVRVIAALLAPIALIQLWIVALVFRCSYFVLKMRAEFNGLPDAAARIAVAHLQGGHQAAQTPA